MFIKKVSKNAEFHADFKKVISKNVMQICTFSTFTHFRQTCFAYNFFGVPLKNFFNGFEISMKFCVFDLKKLVRLFSNFEAKRAKNGAKNGAKNQKTY